MYVTAPERGAPWPGEVVLHYVGGMSEADQMFRGEKMKCLFAIMRDLKARQGPTYDDIEAVRTWLIEQKGCSDKIGVIGFCMGGAIVILLASDHGFKAASVNYGGPLPDDAETFLPEHAQSLRVTKLRTVGRGVSRNN